MLVAKNGGVAIKSVYYQMCPVLHLLVQSNTIESWSAFSASLSPLPSSSDSLSECVCSDSAGSSSDSSRFDSLSTSSLFSGSSSDSESGLSNSALSAVDSSRSASFTVYNWDNLAIKSLLDGVYVVGCALTGGGGTWFSCCGSGCWLFFHFL